MKAAVVLKGWVTDEILFDAGGQGTVWTRKDLGCLAEYLSGTITLNGTFVRLSKRIDWALAKRVRDGIGLFGMEREVTPRWLASKGSLKAVGMIEGFLKIGESGIGGKVGMVGVKGSQKGRQP